jgi:hypothetical protein
MLKQSRGQPANLLGAQCRNLSVFYGAAAAGQVVCIAIRIAYKHQDLRGIPAVKIRALPNILRLLWLRR